VKDPEELHLPNRSNFQPIVAFLVVIPEGNLLLPLSESPDQRQRTASRDNIQKKPKAVAHSSPTTQATTNSPQATIHPPQTHHQKTTSKTQNPWKFATSTTPTFKSENPASR
jgi:hypothetical protein